MPRTTTFHGYKTRVGFGADNAYETNPTSIAGVTYLGELRSVNRSGETISKVNATHLESPNGYQEMIPGFGEGGTFELNFNYNPALERVLNGLTPQPDYAPTGGAASGDIPRYGRRLLFLVDRFGNYTWARVIFDPPSRSVGEDGQQTMTVSITVAEGRPVHVASASGVPFSNPGNYTAPTG
jgi:hypothetical protein